LFVVTFFFFFFFKQKAENDVGRGDWGSDVGPSELKLGEAIAPPTPPPPPVPMPMCDHVMFTRLFLIQISKTGVQKAMLRFTKTAANKDIGVTSTAVI